MKNLMKELEFIDSLVSEQSGRKREQATANTSTTSYETLAMFGPPPPKRPIGPKFAINPIVEDDEENEPEVGFSVEESSGKVEVS